MKRTMKRVVLSMMALLILTLSLTGCMSTASNVKFNGNGSIDYAVDFCIGSENISSDEDFEQFFGGYKESLDAIGITDHEDINENNYRGVRFHKSFPSLDAFLNDEIWSKIVVQMPAPIISANGENDADIILTNKKGFLNSEYTFQGTIAAEKMLARMGMDSATLGEMGDMDTSSMYKIAFTVELPKAAISSDATTIDGNKYTWEADPTKDVPVNMVAKVPAALCFTLPLFGTINLPVILAVIIALVLLLIIAAVIVLIVASVKKKNAKKAEDLQMNEFSEINADENSEIPASDAMTAEETAEEIEEIAEETLPEEEDDELDDGTAEVDAGENE